MGTFIAGLALFFSAHTFILFRDARAAAIDKLGMLGYRGLFSLVSIGGFVLLVMGYADAPRVTVWAPPPWLRHVTMLLMLPTFVILVAAYVPGYIKAKLKNPMLIAVKTWALAHLLSNGDLASMVLFGAFLTFGVIDLIAVKRSGRSAVVESPKAIYDVVAVIAGIVLYAVFVMWLHTVLIGVPVVVI